MTNTIAVASASAWYSDPDFVAARQSAVPAGGVGDYGMFMLISIPMSVSGLALLLWGQAVPVSYYLSLREGRSGG